MTSSQEPKNLSIHISHKGDILTMDIENNGVKYELPKDEYDDTVNEKKEIKDLGIGIKNSTIHRIERSPIK